MSDGHDDSNGVLPEGWVRSKVSDVTVSIPNCKPSDEPDREFRYIDISSIDNERHRVVGTQSFRGDAAPSRARRPVQRGDVIFSNVRTYLRNIAQVPSDIEADLCSTGFTVMRSNGAALADYLFHYATTNQFVDPLTEKQTGSSYPAVTDRIVLASDIPLPPLAEQKRIVAKVEALLERVSKARERLDRVPDILKKFRQSVLAAACSGSLTADWREANGGGETGIDVLRRLQDEHRKRWEVVRRPKKYKPAVRPGFELGCELADTWAVASPEELCDSIVDCPHSTPKWTDQGEICLRTTNFKPGLLDLTEVRYVSSATYEQRISRLEPNAGDVVYSREGGILGIACTIPKGLKACLGQRMMMLRTISDGCEPRFLMHVLNSPAILSIVKEKTGGTSSPHLNVGDIRSFPIPLPSVAEQTEIVHRVDSLLVAAAAIERRIESGRGQADKICQSLLAKAFAGELVEAEADLARREGRDYESATMLLERIAAEKAATQNGKLKRPRKSKAKPPSKARKAVT